MRFYLGVHEPAWLATLGVPLFVSHRRLRRRATMPRAATGWALDSGGFTELRDHGRWTVTPREYAAAVAVYRDEVGRLEWAAPQDWMCEPFMLAKTGLRVVDHQRRTVDNLLELRALDPSLPFVPVLQGWHAGDYLEHAAMYAAAGVDLAAEQLVGLGSVCRRQDTSPIVALARELSDAGVRLHGFGVKRLGLLRLARHLASADSTAWSYRARRRRVPLDGCKHGRDGTGSCSNCPRFAMQWRAETVAALEAGEDAAARQLVLL